MKSQLSPSSIDFSEVNFFPQQPRAYFEDLQYQFTRQSTYFPLAVFKSKETHGKAFYYELEKDIILIFEQYTTQKRLKILQTPNVAKDYLVVRFIKTNLQLTLFELDNRQIVLENYNDERVLLTSQNIGVELLSLKENPKSDVRVCTIVFPKEWLAKKLESELINSWFEKTNTILVDRPLSHSQKGLLNSLFSMVFNEPNYFVWKRDIYGFLIQLIELLRIQDSPFSITKKDRDKIEQVHDFLIQNLTQAPTIEELSQIAQMSASKLKNLFKQRYETPIYTHFLNTRLETAKKLLETGRYTVGQVSLKMGYSQPTKFIIAFKKKYNATPFTFRNNRNPD